MGKVVFERSSGNVFADLGIPQPDEHRLKAALLAKMSGIISERGMTQSEAAEIVGISQPDLSRILRGRFRDVSVERLIRSLRLLGLEVDIGVTERGQPVGETIRLEPMLLA